MNWQGDFYYGKNNAVNTTNNEYLDGIGCNDPEKAKSVWDESDHDHIHNDGRMGGNCIYLWMSDYHPDGGQLFFPKRFQNPSMNDGNSGESNESTFPMFACLGKSEYGDNIRYIDLHYEDRLLPISYIIHAKPNLIEVCHLSFLIYTDRKIWLDFEFHQGKDYIFIPERGTMVYM